MTPEEIKQARFDLGLTTAQLGQMLDIATPRAMRAYMAPETSSTHKPAPVRMARLLRAYMAGYRPDDWPIKKEKENV